MKTLMSTEEWKLWRRISAMSLAEQQVLILELGKKLGLSPDMMLIEGDYVPYDFNAFIDVVDEAFTSDSTVPVYFSPHTLAKVTGSPAENWVAWVRVATDCQGTDSNEHLLRMVAPKEVKESLRLQGSPSRGNQRFLSTQATVFYLAAQDTWSDPDLLFKVVRLKELIRTNLNKTDVVAALVPPGGFTDPWENEMDDFDAEVTEALAPTPQAVDQAEQNLFSMVTGISDDDLDGLLEMLREEKRSRQKRRLATNATGGKITDGEINFSRTERAGSYEWLQITYPDGQKRRYVAANLVTNARLGGLSRPPTLAGTEPLVDDLLNELTA